jgi:hypothetical protein
MVDNNKNMEIFMRNKILLTLLAAACSSALYAGEMGPIDSEAFFRPFVAGEAGYTWPQVDGYSVSVPNLADIRSHVETQGWGGRLALGVMRPIYKNFLLSAEGGLAYFDHTAIEPRFVVSNGAQVIPPPNVIQANFDQYGLDLLAGLIYNQPKYDVFFKAGALIDNTRMHVAVNPNQLLQGNRRQPDFTPGALTALNTNIAQAMPEIRLGGSYHVTDNWSVTAAWMHAFGGKLEVYSPEVNLATNTVQVSDLVLSLNNPTMNSVLFGVQYNFS